MNEEQIKNMLNDDYDLTRELTFGSMIKDFYNKKMKTLVILVWTFALVFIAGAVICAIKFTQTTDTKLLIMYATLFLVCAHWVDLMKIFAWQMIHRNNLKREIKRLEIRIAELNQTIQDK